ncbi:hypothetical protein AGMMS49921_04160 [Endomicrobiia bacterium]|nr:hypothetical protein AGMMS49921_04160 [Endomicrobiia bacterium]
MTATPEKAEKQKADTETKQESKDSKEEECSVCRSNMNKDEDLTTCAKCKNQFYTECVATWFQSLSTTNSKNGRTYPLCRQEDSIPVPESIHVIH